MSNIHDLFDQVDKLCRDAGVEFVFAIPEGTSYSVEEDENLLELVEVIKSQTERDSQYT